MRLLDNDFRFHPCQIGDLFDELFVTSGKNTGEPRLHSRRCTGGDQGCVSIRELQHFGDSFASGDFQVGDGYEMAASLGHYSLKFRPKDGTAKYGHGPFAVDHGFYAELFIGVARLAEAADLYIAPNFVPTL